MKGRIDAYEDSSKNKGYFMQWTRLIYANGMSHVVSDDLIPAIKEAMEHGTPPGVFERATVIHEIGLELGGACVIGRPREELSFCDLAIYIPSEDFVSLVNNWKNTPAATSLSRDFYRFTSWPWQCLVVDPLQRSLLLEILDARADLAERRAAEFWADRKSLKPYNVVVPPWLDKIDRFRS